MSFAYVASPYSHPDRNIMIQRFDNVMGYCAQRMVRGEMVYSPIVHCHEMAQRYELPTDAAFWWKYNAAILCKASEVRVLMLDGWVESVGVNQELDLAEQLSIPIDYIIYTEHIDPIQELLDQEANLSNQRSVIRKRIKEMRTGEPPSCLGLDDCSTNILSKCQWRFDCGPKY